MSPTVFREHGYRFYFFSREETRKHVHVYHSNGEAKFWLEPTIELAQNYGLSAPRTAGGGKFGEAARTGDQRCLAQTFSKLKF
jgi:hypothetical protein